MLTKVVARHYHAGKVEKVQTVEKAKKKRSLKILLSILLALLVLAALTLTTVIRNPSLVENVVTRFFLNNGKADKDQDKITYKGDEGEFSYSQDSTLPEGFPEGFPIYPGAEIKSSWTASGNETKGISVVWESKDSLEAVSSYYKAQLEAVGWEITSNFDQGQSVNYSFEKESVSGFIGIAEAGSATTISLTLGVK